eukprot:scaffold119986_cov12-Tisochrysis_lutea.AAC.1
MAMTCSPGEHASHSRQSSSTPCDVSDNIFGICIETPCIQESKVKAQSHASRHRIVRSRNAHRDNIVRFQKQTYCSKLR